MEGTSEERVAAFTRLLEAEIAVVRTKFKAAPDFVQHAIIESTRSAMGYDLYRMHAPKDWEDGYSEWAKDEALLWLADMLWTNAVASAWR